MASQGFAWGDGIRGFCSRRGLPQGEMCASVRDMCVDGPELIPDCAQTVPDCPDVLIDEYVTCRIDTLYYFVQYNLSVSCASMQPVPEVPEAPTCMTVYQRCPAARALQVTP